MNELDWIKEFPAAVTVCAENGNLLAVNDKAAKTFEKNGIKKLIYQSPWYRDGQYAGFVELSLEIPFDMPHFIRS